jgi:hypothetical protein
MGFNAGRHVKVAHPDKLVIDIDGDGSFLMNIQELATCFCEKIPVKVLLLNNQHLGMVVQWEDRFHAKNRAHTYLGPIDHPEAMGSTADKLAAATRLRHDCQGLSRRRYVKQRSGWKSAQGDDRLSGALRPRRRGALSGARAAHDPRRHDGEGSDQGIGVQAALHWHNRKRPAARAVRAFPCTSGILPLAA